MSGPNPFIGRQRELAKFKMILDRYDEQPARIAFVYDATDKPEEKGGIGKTKLLQKFLEEVKQPQYQERFLVVDQIIDLYEPVNRDRMSRLSAFAKVLEQSSGRQVFDNFWRVIRQYYNREVSEEKVIQEYLRAYQRLAEDSGKKILIIIDTFEIAENSLNFLPAPYRFIEDDEINNSFTIISGRNQPNLSTPLWEGREQQIVEFPLERFNDAEAKQYFESARYDHLSPDQISALNRKAQGRPILLALSVDYLNTILNIDNILDLDDAHFKESMVSFIHDFKEPPLAQAILAMAHIKHRCNKNFLSHFIEPATDPDRDFQKLSQLSFVRDIGKDYIVLHDEMQRMVAEYLLDDVEGKMLRKEFSKEAIKFYEKEIQRLWVEEKQYEAEGDAARRQIVRNDRFIFKAEQWYHRLYASNAALDEIDLYFFDVYDKNLEEAHLDYCFVLQSHLDDLVELLDLPVEVENRIRLRKARLYTEKYQFTRNRFFEEEAETIFEELIEYARKKQQDLFLGILLYTRASLYYYKQKAKEAETLFRQAIDVMSRVKDKKANLYHYHQGIANNWLGYVQYEQGKFSESIPSLEAAETHLKNATKSLKQEQYKDLRQRQIEKWIAQVRGNLCRIYREIGQPDKSIHYGESSLARRRELGNLKEIIKGLNSLGLMYARKGDLDGALTLYREAEDKLQKVPDPILLGRIRTNIATVCFNRDRFSDFLSKNLRGALPRAAEILRVTEDQLAQAENDLTNVIKSLQRISSRELATAYYNLGELHLMKCQFEKALDNFVNTVNISTNRSDRYTLMNALQRLVLTAYLKDDPQLFEKYSTEFMNQLKEVGDTEETKRYVIRYHITLGNYHYDRLFPTAGAKNYDQACFIAAFEEFTNAIGHAKAYSEGSLKFAREVFSERLTEVIKLSGEIPRPLQLRLQKMWKQHGLDTEQLDFLLDF